MKQMINHKHGQITYPNQGDNAGFTIFSIPEQDAFIIYEGNIGA